MFTRRVYREHYIPGLRCVVCPRRALGFRKRAQSAEEESGASLQHLTLTEFLKEYVFARTASPPRRHAAMHVWLNSL